eukprot:gene4997-9998_t
MEKDTAVKVAVRIRPLLNNEISQHCGSCIHVVPGEPQVTIGSDQCFTFDYVFGTDSNQNEVYEDCVVDLVDATFDGFNATVLAYGQTGSGKTFTMGSSSNLRINEEQQGIIPHVIQYVFETVHQKESEDPNCSYRVRIQFLEIYGEEIRDLLEPSLSTKVSIRETAAGEVYVTGAKELLVSSAEEMMMALERGTLSRTTGSTLMNQSSSRSHAIFTILLENRIKISLKGENSENRNVTNLISQQSENINTTNLDNNNNNDNNSINNSNSNSNSNNNNNTMNLKLLESNDIQTCKFHFVDLAGSERAKRTGAEGARLKEGIDINKGLLVLGNVISALGDEKKKGKTHVPYRDSKLTRMLQDSLGGNSKTLMICCVSPADTNMNESLNALRYANRARNIKNKPVVNRDPTSLIISDLKTNVKMLASELLMIRRWLPPSIPNWPPCPCRTSIELLEDLAASVTSSTIIHDGSTLKHQLPSLESITPTLTDVVSNTSAAAAASVSGGINKSKLITSTSINKSKLISNITKDEKLELLNLRAKLMDSDEELQRLTEELKKTRNHLSIVTEQNIIDQSERDFYRMKWMDMDPTAATMILQHEKATLTNKNDEILDNDSINKSNNNNDDDDKLCKNEQSVVTRAMSEYIREITRLKNELSEAKRSAILSNHNSKEENSLQKKFHLSLRKSTSDNTGNDNGSANVDNSTDETDGDDFDSMAALLEGELTSSVAKVIARTQEQLHEEQRRLRRLEKDKKNGKSNNNNNNKDNNDDISDDDEDDDILHSKEVEEADREFQRRQKVMTAEVVDLNESIQVKQQLIQHLKNSHLQYEAMKSFYETKLQALSSEMQEKEDEMSKLQNELHELGNRAKTGPAAAPGTEDRLKEKLQQKEEELKALRSRQQELSHLSRVQTRHIEQISKLSNEIENMKKQKVSLARNMQTEKKSHMQALALKAREIEKLKRDLMQSTAELQKLERDREKSDLKVKEGKIKSKYDINTKYQYPTLSSENLNAIANSSSTTTSSSSSFYKTTKSSTYRTTRNIQRNPASSTSNALSGSTSITYASNHASTTAAISNHRLLTEDELKTKRWIEHRAVEIAVKEELAESLRKHCAEQLALTKKRDALLVEKKKLLSLDGGGQGSGQGQGTMSDLWDLEDQIVVMETQLTARGSHIADMQTALGMSPDDQISSNNAAMISEVLEVLQQSANTSPVAAQDLIRLLFDLLVSNRRRLEQVTETFDESYSQLKSKEEEIEDLKANLAATQRLHDRDLTKAWQEYEEKLTGLFENSNIVQMIQNVVVPVTPTSSSSSSLISTSQSQSQSKSTARRTNSSPNVLSMTSMDNGGGGRGFRHNNLLLDVEGESEETEQQQQQVAVQSKLTTTTSATTTQQPSDTVIEQFKMMLSLSTERNSVLKTQLSRETLKTQDLQERLMEMRSNHQEYKKTMNETQRTIRFLEEECRMLREMAEEFKNRLKASGGEIGQAIIRQVRAAELLRRGNMSSSADTEDDEEDEDDTQSVLGEFSSLADEIHRTGGVAVSSNVNVNLANSNLNLNSKKNNIFDRLTNPSNFTGTQKNLFLQDLETKRAKVLQIKKEEAETKKRVQTSKPTPSSSSSNGGSGSPLLSPLSSAYPPIPPPPSSSSTPTPSYLDMPIAATPTTLTLALASANIDSPRDSKDNSSRDSEDELSITPQISNAKTPTSSSSSSLTARDIPRGRPSSLRIQKSTMSSVTKSINDLSDSLSIRLHESLSSSLSSSTSMSQQHDGTSTSYYMTPTTSSIRHRRRTSSDADRNHNLYVQTIDNKLTSTPSSPLLLPLPPCKDSDESS